VPELSKSTYKMQHLSWFIGFEGELCKPTWNVDYFSVEDVAWRYEIIQKKRKRRCFVCYFL
jgi:hypothetical protein